MSQEILNAAAMIAAIIKTNPDTLTRARQQSSFPDIENLVVKSIATAKTPTMAVQAYARFGALVPDWNFVYASDNGAQLGFSASHTFSEGSAVRGLLSKNSVFVLDRDTNEEMREAIEAKLHIDYSIALDTQTVSYLEPFLTGNNSRLPKDFLEVFEFIAQDTVFVDPIPYMMENLPNVLVEGRRPAIRQKLVGYEKLRDIDAEYLRTTSCVRFRSSEEERNRRVDEHLKVMIEDASKPALLNHVIGSRDALYCILLKMTTIQLRQQKKSLEEKLEEFIEFLTRRLHTVFLRLIAVANEYFVNGQNLTFFGKIQRASAGKTAEMFDHLKNMAWDLLHVQCVEGAIPLYRGSSAMRKLSPRYFFPSLLTCDRKLVEIIDLYPLKSYAYRRNPDRIATFPEVPVDVRLAKIGKLASEKLDKGFSQAEIKRREADRRNVRRDLSTLTRELESEFAKATVIR
ncbi:hypothetical protein P3T18_003114 [Paraburkholderia sp. GAS199]|uniref:hypothetical protein n=1 Tax=Paraburkholderia sp. GAS199 TaxID=3035126 RepID=UPI003D259B83